MLAVRRQQENRTGHSVNLLLENLRALLENSSQRIGPRDHLQNARLAFEKAKKRRALPFLDKRLQPRPADSFHGRWALSARVARFICHGHARPGVKTSLTPDLSCCSTRRCRPPPVCIAWSSASSASRTRSCPQIAGSWLPATPASPTPRRCVLPSALERIFLISPAAPSSLLRLNTATRVGPKAPAARRSRLRACVATSRIRSGSSI